MGLHTGPACEAGLSAGMRTERVSPHIWKKRRKKEELHLYCCNFDAFASLYWEEAQRSQPVRLSVFFVCPSVTNLVNTIFWKWMNWFRCKLAQVFTGQRDEMVNFGGRGQGSRLQEARIGQICDWPQCFENECHDFATNGHKWSTR